MKKKKKKKALVGQIKVISNQNTGEVDTFYTKSMGSRQVE